MQNLWLLVMWATLTASTASANFCMPEPADASSAPAFLNSVVSAMIVVKSARDKTVEVAHAKNPTAIDMMVGIRQTEEFYRCAASYMDQYILSKSETVASSAKGISDSLKVLADGCKATFERLKNELDGGPKKGAGTAAAENADFRMVNDHAWEMFLAGVGLSSHALIVDPSENGGKVAKLMISGQQRVDAIKKLDKIIGKKPRPNEDRAVELAAGFLREFLKDKHWKTLDSK